MHRFLLFVASLVCASCQPKINQQTDLVIVPLGDVSEHHIDSVRFYLQSTFDCSPEVITSVALPEHAFIHVKSPRFRADSLLIFLESIRKIEGADFAFGLTAADISVTKYAADGSIKKPEWKYQDWGIMGLAYRPGRSAIVSTFRLKTRHPNFYDRLRKVSIHELGHNLGRPHCADTICVMTDAAESVKTVDACAAAFCQTCTRALDLQ